MSSSADGRQNYIDDVIHALDRPSSVAEVLEHQFFNPELGNGKGTMVMRIAVKHIRELLDNRGSGRRSSKKVMICFADTPEDTNFAIMKLALILAPEVDGLFFEALAADSAGSGGIGGGGSSAESGASGGLSGGGSGVSGAHSSDGTPAGGEASTGASGTVGNGSMGEMSSWIEKCDVVIAVVSDAFIASTKCGTILSVAAKLGKSVLPVAYSSDNKCLSQSCWPPTKIGGVDVDHRVFELPKDMDEARAAAGVVSSPFPSGRNTSGNVTSQHHQSQQQQHRCPETVLDFTAPDKFQLTFERELLPKLQIGAIDFQKELRRLLASGDILPKQAMGWQIPLEINRDAVVLEELVAASVGSFGEVWRGVVYYAEEATDSSTDNRQV